jgi:hypothetical protein
MSFRVCVHISPETVARALCFKLDHMVDLLTTDFLTTFSHLTHFYFNTFSYLARGLSRDLSKFRWR